MTPPNTSERQERMAELERKIIAAELDIYHPVHQQPGGILALRAELSRLRDEQQKGGDASDWELSDEAKRQLAEIDENIGIARVRSREFVAGPVPSPAPSPGAQDVREALDDALKYIANIAGEVADKEWACLALVKIREALAAIAQSDAQPVGWQRPDAVREALEKAVNKAIGMLVGETGDRAGLVGVEGVEPDDVIETYKALSGALALAKASPAGKSDPDGWLILGGSTPEYTTKKDLAEAYERKGYEIRAFFYTAPPRPDASAGLVDAAEWLKEIRHRADSWHTFSRDDIYKLLAEIEHLRQDADRWRAFLNGIPRNSESKRLLIEYADAIRTEAAARAKPSEKGGADV
jgi:hypothetical protein